MTNKQTAIKIDPTELRPYGDTLNDGRIQLSFALPTSDDAHGKETCNQLLKNMGFEEIEITHVNDLGEGFTHFIAYVTTKCSVDSTKIEVKVVDTPVLGMKALDKWAKDKLDKPLTVVGACIESDAHTVGIDAIMNMKGYKQHYGIERYKSFEAINMGAQVPSEDLLKKAKEVNADAILVSQIVTQKELHIKNLTKLIELAEAEGLRDKMMFICGGPRISHELAIELGYDAGFGTGSFPEDVASFIMFNYLGEEPEMQK